MTNDAKSDLEALLGEGGDPDRLAQLAALLSAALAEGKGEETPDVAELAAYLDRQLSENERLSLQQGLLGSAAAQAEVESAASLLDAVEASSQRPSPELMAQAGALLAAAVVQPKPQRTLWQRLLEPRARIGVGVALASVAAAAVVFSNMSTGLPGPGSAPAPGSSSEAPTASQYATPGATKDHGTSTAIAPPAPTWGAVAVSASGSAYGVSPGAPTEQQADADAVLACIASHGVNCKVTVAAKAQCFAVARPTGGAPVAAAAAGSDQAQRQAMSTCQSAHAGAGACTVIKTFCSEP